MKKNNGREKNHHHQVVFRLGFHENSIYRVTRESIHGEEMFNVSGMELIKKSELDIVNKYSIIKPKYMLMAA